MMLHLKPPREGHHMEGKYQSPKRGEEKLESDRQALSRVAVVHRRIRRGALKLF